jgi:flagellar biosynthesis protein FlhF
MLARLRTNEEWPKIAMLPLREALTEIAVLLRVEYQQRPKIPLGDCVAFLGTAGAGKTTALCKRLAMDVFFKQKRAVVLKVDLDKANPSDGLAVFCDVLGVPMLRSMEELPELAEGETLYIDFPGITPENKSEIDEMSRLLQSTFATSRVLVVNAAYDIELIKQAHRMGASLEATHVVFTHLDELVHWGKLWEFILARDLTPLFLSSGQNIAGDFTETVFDAVLERTFPAVGKEVATNEAGL